MGFTQEAAPSRYRGARIQLYAAHIRSEAHHRHVTILKTIRAVHRGGATGWGILLMDRAVVVCHTRQGAGGTTRWVCGEGLGMCCACRGVHLRPYGYSVRVWTGRVCERLRSSRGVCEGLCLQPYG